MITDLEVLEAARIGLQHQLAEVDRLIAELRGSPEPKQAKQGKFSAETKARMSEAQKKRWAAKGKLQKREEKKPKKRQMSVAGRARIAEATKKRWAAFREAKEKAATA